MLKHPQIREEKYKFNSNVKQVYFSDAIVIYFLILSINSLHFDTFLRKKYNILLNKLLYLDVRMFVLENKTKYGV